jgi:aryl-alcohol dehydrogenase-like predicted oxidoreductase
MKKSILNRRAFLTKSSIGFAGTGLWGSEIFKAYLPSQPAEEPARIKDYRMLGRTGFNVSDIGCGTIGISNEQVLKAILASGVNFIDTGEAYANGNNERMVGKAIKQTARDSLFINTKISIGKNDTEETIKARVSKCLERLQTGYIDGLMLWGVSSVAETKNEVFHSAFRQMKDGGLVKYCGVSCHGSSWGEGTEENMEKIMITAAEDGRFDLVMFVYNYLQRGMGENILKVCEKNNIGTTLMKTNPFGGAYLLVLEMVNNLMKESKPVPDDYKKVYDKIMEKQNQAESILQQYAISGEDAKREAAIGFALNQPSVHSVLITFRSFEDVNTYIPLSGSRLSGRSLSLINSLKDNLGHLYCRHACGLCESRCPYNVRVNQIMRYNHYFMAQGREKYAVQKYNSLQGSKADKCIDCEGYCEVACPFGVPVKLLLAIADENLSISMA